MDRRPPEISTLLLLVAVELRGFLFCEERLEDKNLAETDEEDGDGHECRPYHDPLIQAFGAFAALQFVKLCETICWVDKSVTDSQLILLTAVGLISNN